FQVKVFFVFCVCIDRGSPEMKEHVYLLHLLFKGMFVMDSQGLPGLVSTNSILLPPHPSSSSLSSSPSSVLFWGW
ncbi:hypothetical protein ACQP3F_29050, partial [Escherichia coli]